MARRAKKASAVGQSPPQELEVSPRSGLYLLVITQIPGWNIYFFNGNAHRYSNLISGRIYFFSSHMSAVLTSSPAAAHVTLVHSYTSCVQWALCTLCVLCAVYTAVQCTALLYIMFKVQCKALTAVCCLHHVKLSQLLIDY